MDTVDQTTAQDPGTDQWTQALARLAFLTTVAEASPTEGARPRGPPGKPGGSARPASSLLTPARTPNQSTSWSAAILTAGGRLSSTFAREEQSMTIIGINVTIGTTPRRELLRTFVLLRAPRHSQGRHTDLPIPDTFDHHIHSSIFYLLKSLSQILTIGSQKQFTVKYRMISFKLLSSDPCFSSF